MNSGMNLTVSSDYDAMYWTLKSNQSDNSSNYPDGSGQSILDRVNPTNSSAYMTATLFRNITVPFICVFGGIGNTMAMVTLLYRRLRHTSCNIYLALRSMSDTLFLLTLMAVWFDSVGVPFFHVNGVCQIVVFVSYVTSFLSVWSVTAITFENYIRICHPTKLNRFCTLCKAKVVVVVLVITAVLIYHSSLWTTKIVEVGPDTTMCLTESRYEHIYLILTYVDTVLTLLIPLVVILSLSACIIYSVIKCYRRRVRWRRAVLLTRRRSNFSSTPQAKVTRLLFAVSMTFLVLHTPIHIIKLILIVKLYLLGSESVDPVDAALKKVFENMYYLNFSANFVVFFICGESFRKVFWELFCRCFQRKDIVLRNVEQQTDLTLLNGGRKTQVSDARERASDSSSATSHVYRNNLCNESSVTLLSPSVSRNEILHDSK